MTSRRTAWLTGALLAFPVFAEAQTEEKLRALTLEQLMNLEVTTVARVPQARLQAPAKA